MVNQNNLKQEDILKKRLAKVEEDYKNNVFSKDNFIYRIENQIKQDFMKKDENEKNNPEDENIFNEPIKTFPKEKKEANNRNQINISDNKDVRLQILRPNPVNFNKSKTEIEKSSIRPTERKDLIGNILPEIPTNLNKSIMMDPGLKKDKELLEEIRYFSEKITKIKKEISKVIVGQENIIHGLLRGLICNGHVLLEGVPGIAKTITVRALGEVTGCSVKRVQFTVDLLPTDITGITTYTPGKGFEIMKGPIFANFVIADEINRSPPKTQSALIEAMQEKQVTIGKTTFQLPNPFFVMATKNPLENVGVYTLPEAQVDRFLFNIIMSYPDENDEKKIMEQNTTLNKFEEYDLKPIITPKDILKMQDLVKKIYLSDSIKDYILSIVKKTRDKSFKYSESIAYGASPRASIALFIASKARALMEGRTYVIPEDVREVSNDVLRHRLILTYRSTIMNLTPEIIIKEILDEVPV